MRAYLGLGSNLGDRAAHLRTAVRRLDAHPSIDVAAVSAVYESAAHTLDPRERQPSFLNAAVEIHTTLPAEELLNVCQEVEREQGRNREKRWAPRTLDVDILMFGVERRLEAPVVPHPRMAERRFVLQPLADIAAEVVVPPPLDATVRDLLEHCPDRNVPLRTGLLLTATRE